DLLARIAGEVEVLPDAVTVAGVPVPVHGRRGGAQGAHAVLTDVLLDRYHLGGAGRPSWSDPSLVRGVADLLGARCCWEDGWRVVAGTAGPVPRTGPVAECSLHLLAGSAPEVFAALVTRLDALHLAFTARLLADPSAAGRPDAAVVTAARGDLPSLVLVALG